MKNYVYITRREDAKDLNKMGFPVVKIMNDRMRPTRYVWLFEDTPELR